MMRRMAILLALVLTGCGGDDDNGTTGTDGGSDASTGGSGGTAGSGATGGGGTAGSGATGGSGGATGGSGGATGGAAGAAGTGATGGAAGASGAAGAAGAAGSGGGCDATNCEWTCCNGKCTNTTNDFKNCGGCGTACTGPNPFCDNGTCQQNPPCTGSACTGGQLCCGGDCCNNSEICCNVPGPVVTDVACTKPTAEGTCPLGCKTCVCTSPDTPIATPTGDRPIAELRVGDLVYSVNHGAVEVVPIRAIHSQPARSHHVMRVVLDGGRVLNISPGHPTADGRTFGQLRAGQTLDGVRLRMVTLVPYEHPRTYDILPESDTGTYFAGGALIGSTLHAKAEPAQACTDATIPESR